MAEINGVGKIVFGGIVLILGAVLIGVLGDEVKQTTESSELVSNQSITFNASGTDDGITDQISDTALPRTTLLSLSAVTNITTEDLTALCTLDTTTKLVSCTGTGNESAYVDYNIEPDDYVHNAAAATMMGLITLFFALAVMLIGVGIGIQGFKEMGL